MMWIWILLALIALLVLAFAWGIRSLRRSSGQAAREIGKVVLADVERLSEECQHVVKASFGEVLSLDEFEGSAVLLSRRVDDGSFKKAFAKDEFWWYYVLPVGAFVGELLRVHTGGQWQPSPEGGLELRIPLKEGESITYPFDKILKQDTMGGKGDLYTYLKAALQLDAIVVQNNVAA